MDDVSGEYYFLEMNTRLQVEHPVTEATHLGLDIVELMIAQGIAQRESPLGGLEYSLFDRSKFAEVHNLHAIEARIYCENPSAGFKPTPGILQYVHFPSGSDYEWLRIDTWVETGTTVTPYFDPLIAKVIVHAAAREEAIQRLDSVLREIRVCGPPNNLPYLQEIVRSEIWIAGSATTTFLDTFQFVPRWVISLITPARSVLTNNCMQGDRRVEWGY